MLILNANYLIIIRKSCIKTGFADNGFAVLFSFLFTGVFYSLHLLSHPGLPLLLAHVPLSRKRSAGPRDPFEIAFQPVALLSIAPRRPVGVVVDVPESEGLALGQVVVRRE